MKIIIRPYEAVDWPRIEAIHDAARKQELALAGLEDAFVPLAQAALNEGLFDYTLRVACIDGTVTGFAAYTQEELAWLYVEPSRMRQGIGRALVNDVCGQTRRPLSVEVLAGNLPALALYTACGFQEVAVEEGQMPGNEAFHVRVHVLQMA